MKRREDKWSYDFEMEEEYRPFDSHCLKLLATVAEDSELHFDLRPPQSLKGLANDTEIPYDNLKAIIYNARNSKRQPERTDYLSIAAHKYRFEYVVYPPGWRRIIDAEYRGYSDPMPE